MDHLLMQISILVMCSWIGEGLRVEVREVCSGHMGR